MNMSAALIAVPHSVRLDQCESMLAQLTPATALQLPFQLDSNGAFGLESSLIHLIVSWARKATRPSLRLLDGHSTATALSKLSQSSYGLAALVLADEVRASGQELVPAHEVKKITSRRLEELGSGNARLFQQAEGLHVLSVYGAEGEFRHWPFLGADSKGQPRIENRDEVTKWLAPRLLHLLPDAFKSRLANDRIADLASITFELLENATLHARHDDNLDLIQRGVRGVTVRVVEVPYASMSAISGGNSDVSFYFVNHALRDVQKRNLFLELSVFDSGIGYHRWVNAKANQSSASPELVGLDEHETVRKCFLKHYTSRGEDAAGVGLWRVVKLLLAQFGFIKLRTGRCCLYARLDQRADGSIRTLGERFDDILSAGPPLKDWFPASTLEDCAGASITFTVPLTAWRSTP